MPAEFIPNTESNLNGKIDKLSLEETKNRIVSHYASAERESALDLVFSDYATLLDAKNEYQSTGGEYNRRAEYRLWFIEETIRQRQREKPGYENEYRKLIKSAVLLEDKIRFREPLNVNRSLVINIQEMQRRIIETRRSQKTSPPSGK